MKYSVLKYINVIFIRINYSCTFVKNKTLMATKLSDFTYIKLINPNNKILIKQPITKGKIIHIIAFVAHLHNYKLGLVRSTNFIATLFFQQKQFRNLS